MYYQGGAPLMKKLWDFLQQNQEQLSDDVLQAKLAAEVHPFFEQLHTSW
ncbi:MAG TPA: hypothetical protein PKE63_01020 [Lacibacter sp.]|nr:hypothetical protein [Lacibacter sp.]